MAEHTYPDSLFGMSDNRTLPPHVDSVAYGLCSMARFDATVPWHT